jgi:hypothetical protein
MEHPLKSEESFEKYLETLSCNGCFLFVNKKCTDEKSLEHEKDKQWISEHLTEKGDEFSLQWVKDINNHFVCESFEDGKGK